MAIVRLVARVDCAGEEGERGYWLPVPCSEKKNRGKQLQLTGTGFFVGDESGQYLVTAGHVVANTLPGGTYCPSRWHASPNSCPPLTTLNSAPAWEYHPEADIAVLRVVKMPNDGEGSPHRFMPIGQLSSSTKPPSRKVSLTAWGHSLDYEFPQSIPCHQASGPNGFVSVKVLGRLCVVFLANPMMPEGMSGGPVIDESDGTCLGLSSGAARDNSFAAIAPACYIRETIATASKTPA